MKNSKKKQKLKTNRIICGDVLASLKKIPDESINLIITSPPYFQQRDYQMSGEEIGNEKALQEYMTILYDVFIECYRVTRKDGNIVFNLGDKYIDKSLQLIPYRFAGNILDYCSVKLINNITWVKSNPTPRQYNRRLVNATEPFFHFAKTEDYYYDRESFCYEKQVIKKVTDKKGKNYEMQIRDSNLTTQEKLKAMIAVAQARLDISEGKISDFRMKIRGIHKLAFGGQQGGRNNEIKNNGFTIIRMTGQKMKSDAIINPVDNNKGIKHPAIFPIKVIKELVLLLSPEDGIVLDPFCGSGTTCLAAKELGRQYLGIDLSEKYCNISRSRLSSYLIGE